MIQPTHINPTNMVDQESTQGFIRITYYHGLLIAGGFTILGGLIGRGSIIISLGAEIKPIKDLMPALLFMKPSGQQSGNLKKKGVLILRLSSCASALGKQVTEVERFRFHLSKRKRKALFLYGVYSMG